MARHQHPYYIQKISLPGTNQTTTPFFYVYYNNIIIQLKTYIKYEIIK